MRISPQLEEDVRNQYSYLVAYENLLRGTGLTELRDETFIDGKRTAADFKPGNVTSFTKLKKEAGSRTGR